MQSSYHSQRSIDVFLCHNSKDKPEVRELAKRLRALQVDVWLDEDRLQPGKPNSDQIELAIKSASAVAVLVAKDGFGLWSKEEFRWITDEAINRGIPVLAVLLPGAPSVPDLPLALKVRGWVDFRDGFSKREIDKLYFGVTGKRIANDIPVPAAGVPMAETDRLDRLDAIGESPINLPVDAIQGGHTDTIEDCDADVRTLEKMYSECIAADQRHDYWRALKLLEEIQSIERSYRDTKSIMLRVRGRLGLRPPLWSTVIRNAIWLCALPFFAFHVSLLFRLLVVAIDAGLNIPVPDKLDVIVQAITFLVAFALIIWCLIRYRWRRHQRWWW